MEILQLFLFWAVLGVSIIVKHKILQSSLIMSIQCFFGPSSLPYLVSSSKYCYLWISVVIHSHNMTKVSQAKLPYPVVYFLPQIEMFPNAIIAQPVSLYNDENPPEKCHLKYIQSMFWGSVHFPSFRVVKKADQDNVLYICNFIFVIISLVDQTFPSAWNAVLANPICLLTSEIVPLLWTVVSSQIDKVDCWGSDLLLQC